MFSSYRRKKKCARLRRASSFGGGTFLDEEDDEEDCEEDEEEETTPYPDLPLYHYPAAAAAAAGSRSFLFRPQAPLQSLTRPPRLSLDCNNYLSILQPTSSPRTLLIPRYSTADADKAASTITSSSASHDC